MKAYKFLMCLIALTGLTLSSCENTEDEIFEESASARVQGLMDDTQKTLASAEHGWVFDYYPDRELSYGGFLYTLKFTQSEVTAYAEIATDVTKSYTSLYSMTNDDGAVLSFNSYNQMLHFFATPSSSRYEAYDGDFEFKVLKLEEDLITLKGKRSGNVMYLRRLSEDPAQYLQKCVETSDNIFISELNGTIGANAASAVLDFDIRYITIVAGAEEAGAYYLPTPTGIRFMSPIEINGASFSELTFDSEELVFNGTDSKGNAITLAGELAPDYMKRAEFIGDWTYYYYPSGSKTLKSVDVSLVPIEGTNDFEIHGLNPKFNPIATYSKTLGRLELCSQPVGAIGSNVIWLCAWDTEGGTLTWSTDAGMYIKKSLEEENTVIFTVNDNGQYDISSFILWQLTATNTSIGALSDTAWRFTGTTSNRMYYPTKMVKK